VRLQFEDGERELLIARLGLDADADDSAVAQAVASWMAEDPPSGSEDNDDENENDNLDDLNASAADVVVVDVAEFRRLRSRDRVAGQVEEAMRIRDRDELIEEAIHDGKFGPARRDHYRDRFDSDPDGTTALIGRLTPNTVPIEERGADVPTDDVDNSAYPTDWVPEVAARAARKTGRVHGED